MLPGYSLEPKPNMPDLTTILVFYSTAGPIDEFTLLSASWVIRARWREIQRFVRKFKTMKSIHDMQFWVFIFQNRRYVLKGAAE